MAKTKDKTPKGDGRSAAFQIRIHPTLHAQIKLIADSDNMTLSCWLKELARRELRHRGIKPEG